MGLEWAWEIDVVGRGLLDRDHQNTPKMRNRRRAPLI